MMQLKKLHYRLKMIEWADYFAPIAILIVSVFVINALMENYVQSSDRDNEVISDIVLSYCPEPSVREGVCQGAGEIDYFVRTHQPKAREIHGFGAAGSITVKVQDILLKLNANAQETFDELYLYKDSNRDGVFEVKKDKQLASAVLKKKRALFEDLNLQLSYRPSGQTVEFSEKFFIANDSGQLLEEVEVTDGEEVTKEPLIKSIEVAALNIENANEEVPFTSSVVDLTRFDYKDDLSQSAQQLVKRWPSLFSYNASSQTLSFKKGELTVSENLIIPKDLQVKIQPGTTIAIAPDTSVVSYSVIDMRGTAASPIIIKGSAEAAYNTFAVLGGYGNTQTMNVQHVQVSGGSEARINGAFISGMFSVYRVGQVNVSNSVFDGSRSDDGLNIKYANVDMRHNTFLNNKADAFDGDFVIGPITQNLFYDNGNDSLDFSGSNVDLSFNNVLDSGDKCISVGEATTARITQNNLSGCYIGVEVKDRSNATITNNLIIDSRNAGINAYVKKAFFGEPTLSYSDNLMLSNATLTTELATTAENSGNITDGTVETNRKELPWLNQLLQKLPQR